MNIKQNITGWLGMLAIVSSLTGLAAAEPSASGHLFILSGQSNMRQPLPASFEAVVSKVFGKENVAFASFSVPSQPIRQWCKNWTPPEGVAFQPAPGEANGALYDKLMESVRRVASNRQFATVTFVWMQGEADGSAGLGAVYEKSFLGIIDQLKADLKRDDIRFVLGRINDHQNEKEGNGRAVVREAQVKLGTQYPNGAWVDTDDLNTGINPWCAYEDNGEHFPNQGYKVIGQRFARAACKQIDPNIKFDESVFDACFFDSATQISKHAAIGSALSGTTPDAKHAALAKLTDGSYGADDPESKEWVAFAPSQKSVELIMDLGKPQNIQSIAVNVLIHTAAGAGFPMRMDLYTSKDGQAYEILQTRRDAGIVLNAKRGSFKLPKPEARLALVEIDRPDVRYVKVTFAPGESWLFLDEILINPQPKTTSN